MLFFNSFVLFVAAIGTQGAILPGQSDSSLQMTKRHQPNVEQLMMAEVTKRQNDYASDDVAVGYTDTSYLKSSPIVEYLESPEFEAATEKLYTSLERVGLADIAGLVSSVGGDIMKVIKTISSKGVSSIPSVMKDIVAIVKKIMDVVKGNPKKGGKGSSSKAASSPKKGKSSDSETSKAELYDAAAYI